MTQLEVFVCFVALRPKSTAMVMAGRSVHLTTLFLGKLEHAVNQGPELQCLLRVKEDLS